MNADDPRHGTTRGYNAGCHDSCCRAAIAHYMREGRALRSKGGRTIPAIGAQRRIRALMRLGWTSKDIAHAAGWANRNQVDRILNGQKGKPTSYLERATDQATRTAYDKLSMRLPAMTPGRARTRALATRRAWPSCLAWDDETIDDPNARPAGMQKKQTCRHRDEIDEVAVIRAARGDRSITLTKAERAEVSRRLREAGWSFARIEEHTGLKADRYLGVAA